MIAPSHMIASIDAALAEYTAGIDRAVRFVTIDQVDMLAEFYLHNRRTPDPAQIRDEALREAIWAAFIAGVDQGSDEATAYEWGTAPQQSRQQAFDDFMADWNEDSAYLRSLLDTPLSPTAVDNSPAPDAGGKKPCGECFIPENEICDICGAVGPSGKAGGKEGV